MPTLPRWLVQGLSILSLIVWFRDTMIIARKHDLASNLGFGAGIIIIGVYLFNIPPNSPPNPIFTPEPHRYLLASLIAYAFVPAIIRRLHK